MSRIFVATAGNHRHLAGVFDFGSYLHQIGAGVAATDFQGHRAPLPSPCYRHRAEPIPAGD